MKNLSVILNVILIIALIPLYIKYFSNKDEKPIPVSGKAATSKIVFVNSDSLMSGYTMFQEIQKSIDARRDSLDKMLTARGKSLENEIRAYQEKGATMSDAQRQAKEDELSRKQQAFVSDRESILDKLKTDEAAIEDSLHNDIVKAMRAFNKNKGYDFILGYTRGGGILYADDSLDVTPQVMKVLNQK